MLSATTSLPLLSRLARIGQERLTPRDQGLLILSNDDPDGTSMS